MMYLFRYFCIYRTCPTAIRVNVNPITHNVSFCGVTQEGWPVRCVIKTLISTVQDMGTVVTTGFITRTRNVHQRE